MTGRAAALITGCAIIGAAAGPCLAWLLVSVHALSPDNVPAGLALGFGGDVAGLLAALLLLALTRNGAPA